MLGEMRKIETSHEYTVICKIASKSAIISEIKPGMNVMLAKKYKGVLNGRETWPGDNYPAMSIGLDDEPTDLDIGRVYEIGFSDPDEPEMNDDDADAIIIKLFNGTYYVEGDGTIMKREYKK